MHTNTTSIVYFLTISFTSVACANTSQFGIRYGHLYGVIEGGIREYSSELQPIASLQIQGVSVTEGVAFTPQGNLVFSAFRANTSGSATHHVIEVNSSGTIVNEIDLGIGSLDRAAHLDIDANGNVYLASTPNVIEVPPNFGSFRILPHNFGRSSGVAVGPDNRLYVTDQSEDELVVFDEDRNPDHVIPLRSTPTGLDFDARGKLFATVFSSRELREINLALNTSSTILGNLGDVTDIAFGTNGGFYLSLGRGNLLQRYDKQGTLLASVSSGGFTDSIAVFIPEPTAMPLLATALAAAGVLGGRRHGTSAPGSAGGMQRAGRTTP